ncbi:MAG: hypothetical protein V3S01_09350 [Dehalococcoidia bacterium]
MIRAILLALLLALPAQGITRLDRTPIELMTACTDSFDTPATTDGTNLATIANWDTEAEAVDPSANINDAVQTTGSADGWCDARPWVIEMTTNETLAGSKSQFIGPFTFPAQGVHTLIECDVTGRPSNMEFHWRLQNPWDVGSTSFPFYSTPRFQGSRAIFYSGPHENRASKRKGEPAPAGATWTLEFVRNTAVTSNWTCDVWLLPAQDVGKR